MRIPNRPQSNEYREASPCRHCRVSLRKCCTAMRPTKSRNLSILTMRIIWKSLWTTRIRRWITIRYRMVIVWLLSGNNRTDACTDHAQRGDIHINMWFFVLFNFFFLRWIFRNRARLLAIKSLLASVHYTIMYNMIDSASNWNNFNKYAFFFLYLKQQQYKLWWFTDNNKNKFISLKYWKFMFFHVQDKSLGRINPHRSTRKVIWTFFRKFISEVGWKIRTNFNTLKIYITVELYLYTTLINYVVSGRSRFLVHR